MFQVERKQQILNYVNEHQKANTDELAEMFHVSRVTIRRDLDELFQQGLLLRTHGGAVSNRNSMVYEIPYLEKIGKNVSAKERIGIMAASLIQDNDIIILDSGSTTIQVAKHITQKNVTVLTNDIQIVNELIPKDNVEVYMAGGHVAKGVYTILGSACMQFFDTHHANRLFLGCDAVSLKYGISNRTDEEVLIKQCMIANADEIIAVTDHSKIGGRVFARICPVSELDKLVTDTLTPAEAQALSSMGVEVILAG